MTTQQQDVVDQLHRQYSDLDDQHDDVFDADAPITPDQRKQYVCAVSQALANYLDAYTNMMKADDDQIQHIKTMAMAAQCTLDSALIDLTALAGKIGLVTSALNIVGQALQVLAV